MTARALVLFVALAAPAGADEAVQRLIEALGAPEWEVRDAAERALVEVGCPAMPAIEAARAHPDPEVARRATRCRHAIRARLPGDDLDPEWAAELEAKIQVLVRASVRTRGWTEGTRRAQAAVRDALEATIVGVDRSSGVVRLGASLPPGVVLHVYRGRSYVASLIVESAGPDHARARVDTDRTLGPVEVGDRATTRDAARHLAGMLGCVRADDLVGRPPRRL